MKVHQRGRRRSVDRIRSVSVKNFGQLGTWDLAYQRKSGRAMSSPGQGIAAAIKTSVRAPKIVQRRWRSRSFAARWHERCRSGRARPPAVAPGRARRSRIGRAVFHRRCQVREGGMRERTEKHVQNQAEHELAADRGSPGKRFSALAREGSTASREPSPPRRVRARPRRPRAPATASTNGARASWNTWRRCSYHRCPRADGCAGVRLHVQRRSRYRARCVARA